MSQQHIVLATEISDEPQPLHTAVAHLAESIGARITLLHVVQTLIAPVVGSEPGIAIRPPDFEEETRSAEQALQRLADALPAGLDLSPRVIQSPSVAEGVLEFAESNDADLIALSTHGRKKVRRLVLGSVAEAILRHASVPILCLPQRADANVGDLADVRHLLITTDLSTEALRPFTDALALARSLDCRVTVLHVVPALQAIPYGAPLAPPLAPPELPQDMARAQALAEEQCAPFALDVFLSIEVIANESPSKGIVQFAAEHDVDLIALSTHGRSGFRRLALGSVAEQVLRESNVPVLSFQRRS